MRLRVWEILLNRGFVKGSYRIVMMMFQDTNGLLRVVPIKQVIYGSNQPTKIFLPALLFILITEFPGHAEHADSGADMSESMWVMGKWCMHHPEKSKNHLSNLCAKAIHIEAGDGIIILL